MMSHWDEIKLRFDAMIFRLYLGLVQETLPEWNRVFPPQYVRWIWKDAETVQ